MKSPPLIPPDDWEREDRDAMHELANELGRAGKLGPNYGRRKSRDDWREPIEGEVKFG